MACHGSDGGEECIAEVCHAVHHTYQNNGSNEHGGSLDSRVYFIETKMVPAAEPSNATLFNNTLDSESSWMHWWYFVNTMDPLSASIIQPIG